VVTEMFDAGGFVLLGPDRGVRLKPAACRRFLTEYEKWMLGKGDDSIGFRKALRQDVVSPARRIPL
jgi:hypothetical protein